MSKLGTRIARQLTRIGWFALIGALVLAAYVVFEGRHQRAAVAMEWRGRNRLKMLAARTQIEAFLAEIEFALRLVAAHPGVIVRNPACRDYLQTIYETNKDRHRLSEIYVIEHDFDGTRPPWMTLERCDTESEEEEQLHTLEREAEEYAAQIKHIRRFAENPNTTRMLISEQVKLCVGGTGLVFSAPIRSDDRLVGIVAGMVRSYDISDVLEKSSLGNQIVLVDARGAIFGCHDVSAAVVSWFRNRFQKKGAPEFFKERGTVFPVAGHTALRTEVDAPGGEQWHLAFVYDEAQSLLAGEVGAVLAEWGAATLIVVLGCAVALLCRAVRALLGTRHESELRARALADLQAQTQAAVDGIITIDERGVIDSVNAATERIFGYAPGELIGMNVSVLMPAPHNERHNDYITRYLQTGQPKVLCDVRERLGRRKDGSVFPLEVAVGEARLPGRSLFTGIVRDVTDRRRTEAALRESEQRLHAIMDNTTHLVYVVSAAGRMLLGNRRFEEVYQVDRGHGIGKGLHDLLPKDLADTLRARHQRILRRNGPEEFCETVTLHDGVHYFTTIEFPLYDETQEPYAVCGISSDVTVQRHAEEEERRRDAELAHLARVALMGEMAAGFAHELNQPLTAIVTYAHACAQRLRMQDFDTDQLLEDVAQVSAQGQRAGAIIQRIKEFVRKDIPEPKPFDLNTLAREALEMIRFECQGQEIELRCQLSERLPSLVGDPVQILQVILNLIRNAIEAIRETNMEKRRVTLGTRAQGDGMVEFAVVDTGPGLQGNAFDRACESFYTTKPGGMGMGLPICRSIIEQHGGHLYGTNDERGGAIFRFSLPVRNGSLTGDL